MDNDVLITTEQLIDYLGTDDDSAEIISAARDAAIEEIKTGVGLTDITGKAPALIDELIRILVYISYYAVRGGADNVDYLERRKIQLFKMLQYTGDAQENGT